MAMLRIREVLLGNWRNKGVALFFAATIWFVAFQAETQNATIPIRLIPATRQEGIFIIRQECADPQGQGKQVPFDGTVKLTVSGPRRQVEKLKGEGIPLEVKFPVESGGSAPEEPQRVALTGEKAFSFIPPGVQIDKISPESILITFDHAVEKEIPVEPVYQRIPEGMEEETVKIEPATVKLSGPRSILEVMKATVEAWIGASERYEEELPVNKRYPEAIDRTLVDRTVRFIGPAKAKLSVRLRYKSDSFVADGVRVRFLVPPSKLPFRIQFDDETVKVRFQGPMAEIARLVKIAKEPDFALAVPVDPAILPAEGLQEARERTGTFTEDSLVLYRFSDRIQIHQHPDRQAQGKGPWTYSIIPIAAPAGKTADSN